MLEKRPETPERYPPEKSNNKIIVDWLSVTFHDMVPEELKSLLGLNTDDIPWQDLQMNRNGYPRQMFFGNIVIRYGADDAANYTDDANKTAQEKVNKDMGIALDMSGQGCRQFETYGYFGQEFEQNELKWVKLLHDILALDTRINITRIDLAFDDRAPDASQGILPIGRIIDDTRDENWTGSSTVWQIMESGDQKNKLRGRTAYIGSPKSMVRLRIYDKAAERGFTESEMHWIRAELTLRHDRANAAVKEIVERNDVGEVYCGVLRNFCCYREPSLDSNKSRWPIATYWEKLLHGAQRIRLFSAPGEEYNFKKTEDSLINQYGQAVQVIFRVHGQLTGFLNQCRAAHPTLKPKYQKAIHELEMEIKLQHLKIEQIRREIGFTYEDLELVKGVEQIDFAELLYETDNPATAEPRYKIPD